MILFGYILGSFGLAVLFVWLLLVLVDDSGVK